MTLSVDQAALAAEGRGRCRQGNHGHLRGTTHTLAAKFNAFKEVAVSKGTESQIGSNENSEPANGLSHM
jgi:hypothetical protein